MLNTLFGEAVAKVSKTPGRTRQINIFKVSHVLSLPVDVAVVLVLVLLLVSLPMLTLVLLLLLLLLLLWMLDVGFGICLRDCMSSFISLSYGRATLFRHAQRTVHHGNHQSCCRKSPMHASHRRMPVLRPSRSVPFSRPQINQ